MKNQKKQSKTKFDIWPPPKVEDNNKERLKKAKNKSFVDNYKKDHFESQEIFDISDSENKEDDSKIEKKTNS